MVHGPLQALLTLGPLPQGQPLIDGTLESIKHVMKGMDIATSNARYLFLVYNGSVQHWHVARPLQRAQMRKYLAPSMEKVMLVGPVS